MAMTAAVVDVCLTRMPSAPFARTLRGIGGELATAGYILDSWWNDPEGRFALSLARAR